MKNPLNAIASRGIPRSTRKEDEQPVTTPEAPPHMLAEKSGPGDLETYEEPDLGIYESDWDTP